MTSLKLGKKAGLKFPEKVKLLSVFQNSPGDVSNFHTAITYEKMAVSMSLKNRTQHFLIGGAASIIGQISKHIGYQTASRSSKINVDILVKRPKI